MDKIIVICKVCGNRILFSNNKQVVTSEIAQQLKDADVEQNGTLYWNNSTVVPVKPVEDTPNAFLSHELVHKVEAETGLEIVFRTAGAGLIRIDLDNKEFEFDGSNVGEADALGQALLYIKSQE